MHHHRIGQHASQYRASIWLALTIGIVSSTMMHPTGASLIAIGMVVGLAFLLRAVAHWEGRYEGAQEHYEKENQ